jgi:hypothetical protein
VVAGRKIMVWRWRARPQKQRPFEDSLEDRGKQGRQGAALQKGRDGETARIWCALRIRTGKLLWMAITPRSLHCATRRAKIRRDGEDRVAPVGMTRGLTPCRDGVQHAGPLHRQEQPKNRPREAGSATTEANTRGRVRGWRWLVRRRARRQRGRRWWRA